MTWDLCINFARENSSLFSSFCFGFSVFLLFSSVLELSITFLEFFIGFQCVFPIFFELFISSFSNAWHRHWSGKCQEFLFAMAVDAISTEDES